MRLHRVKRHRPAFQEITHQFVAHSSALFTIAGQSSYEINSTMRCRSLRCQTVGTRGVIPRLEVRNHREGTQTKAVRGSKLKPLTTPHFVNLVFLVPLW